MKTSSALLFIAVCVVVLPALSMADPATSIRVVSADSFKDNSSPNGDDETEIWAYRITLQNSSGRDLPDLEVRYRVFYFEQLDANGRPLDAMSNLDGKVEIPLLKKLEKKTVNSKEMPFGNPGNKMVRPERDVWKGIWIRVFDKEGKELGSLVKPASFAKTHPWK